MIKPQLQLYHLLISRPGDGVWSLWHQNFKKTTYKNLVAATKWRLVKHWTWSLTSTSCLSTQRLWDLSILGQLSWKSIDLTDYIWCEKYILGCSNACRDPHTYSFLLGLLSASFPLPRYGLGMEKEHVRFQITTFVASIVALVTLIHSPAQVTFGFFPPSPIWPWNGDASLIPARAMHSSQSQSRLKSTALQSNWISTKNVGFLSYRQNLVTVWS